MQNVNIESVSIPFGFRGDVVATAEGITVTGPPAGTIAGIALVEEDSTVTWHGGRYENVAGETPPFFVRGQSTFIGEDLTITNIGGAGLILYDNAKATLRRTQIADAGRPLQSGINSAAIVVGPQNTAVPLTTSLTLESSSVTGNRGFGIGFQQYDRVTAQRVTLVDSHVDGNARAGIEVASPALTLDGGLLLRATNSTIDRNGAGGVVMAQGSVELSGGSIQNNGQHGVRIAGAAVNRLIARGTRVAGNRGHGLWFNGNAAAQLDLGTAEDGGGLTFAAIDGGFSAVRLEAPIVGFAVGNTWEPNEQSANSEGQYTSPLTFITGASGRNVTVLDGGSLMVR